MPRSLQNAAKASGKGAARDLEGGYCLTLLSEATRKVLGKRPEACKMQQKPLAKGAARLKPLESSWKVSRSLQNAAKASAKGAARHLEGSYCLTLLSEATRKVLGKRPEACKMQQKPLAKGAARHLEGSYCLTLLSEATRKVLGKRLEACKMQQKPLVRALRGIWREATA